MISIRRKIDGANLKALNQVAGRVDGKYKIAVQPAKSGFLKFSHKVDYGLFLMTELAKKRKSLFDAGVPVSLREISEQNQMSFFFMQKVAFDLRKAGLIGAGRGKNGGYTLAKQANKISLKEILEALEGPLKVMDCLGHGADEIGCVRESSCGMRGGLNVVNSIIVNTLAKTKLTDLFRQSQRPESRKLPLYKRSAPLHSARDVV